MNEDILRTDEAALAEALKREAQATRPLFSEELHARICAAVRQCSVPSQACRPEIGSGVEVEGSVLAGTKIATVPPTPSSRIVRARWVAYAALAATLLVAGLVTVVTWQPGAGPVEMVQQPPGTDTRARPDDVAVFGEFTEEALRHVDSLVAVDPGTRFWGPLDHDVRLAAGLLLDQVPWELAMADRPQRSVREGVE